MLEKWYILLLFSALCTMSNILCFSFSPIEASAAGYYNVNSMELFPIIYFISFFVVTVPTNYIIYTCSVRVSILIATFFMCLGAIVRSITQICEWDMEAVYIAMIGQVLASFSQCVWTNLPSLISLLWFPYRLRIVATSIACNAKMIGVAGAYVLSPYLVQRYDLARMNDIYAYCCICLFALVLLYFPVHPSFLPSIDAQNYIRRWKKRQVRKAQDQYNTFVENINHGNSHFTPRNKTRTTISAWKLECTTCRYLVGRASFVAMAFVFTISDIICNLYAVSLHQQITTVDMDTKNVPLMGVIYIVAMIFGSAVIGSIASTTGKITCILLGTSITTCITSVCFTVLIALKLTDPVCFAIVIGCLGFFIGPIQPLLIEHTLAYFHTIREISVIALFESLSSLGSIIFIYSTYNISIDGTNMVVSFFCGVSVLLSWYIYKHVPSEQENRNEFDVIFDENAYKGSRSTSLLTFRHHFMDYEVGYDGDSLLI